MKPSDLPLNWTSCNSFPSGVFITAKFSEIWAPGKASSVLQVFIKSEVMARKWNTDTCTFCVVKPNIRNRVLSLAIPLNVLTRQQRYNDMGDGFLWWFHSCGALTCTFKEVMSSKACFRFSFVSNNSDWRWRAEFCCLEARRGCWVLER